MTGRTFTVKFDVSYAFKKKLVKYQGQKVKYKQKDFTTGNTHVNYQSSGTSYSMFLIRLKYLKIRLDSKVKVIRSKLLVSMEQICYYKYSCEISKL